MGKISLIFQRLHNQNIINGWNNGQRTLYIALLSFLPSPCNDTRFSLLYYLCPYSPSLHVCCGHCPCMYCTSSFPVIGPCFFHPLAYLPLIIHPPSLTFCPPSLHPLPSLSSPTVPPSLSLFSPPPSPLSSTLPPSPSALLPFTLYLPFLHPPSLPPSLFSPLPPHMYLIPIHTSL